MYIHIAQQQVRQNKVHTGVHIVPCNPIVCRVSRKVFKQLLQALLPSSTVTLSQQTQPSLMCTLLLQRAVDKASEELSSEGPAEDVWADWESITDAVDSRQWLQANVVITRGVVHAAAAAFADAFKQVRLVVRVV
jgi:hypothetical protein